MILLYREWQPWPIMRWLRNPASHCDFFDSSNNLIGTCQGIPVVHTQPERLAALRVAQTCAEAIVASAGGSPIRVLVTL